MYKILITWLDGTTTSYDVVMGSFKMKFGYIFLATEAVTGKEIYINRYAARSVLYGVDD